MQTGRYEKAISTLVVINLMWFIMTIFGALLDRTKSMLYEKTIVVESEEPPADVTA